MAVAVKVVGVLLIVAMLIIPAEAARILARTPEAMAAIASIIVAASARAAFVLDTLAGPSIVCIAAIFLSQSHLLGLLKRYSLNN